MAGIRGKSGAPGNQNAFRHGLAGIAQRRADGLLNPQNNQSEKKSYPASWPTRAELRRPAQPCTFWPRSFSAVSLSVTFNHAIDGVIQNNPKARANPKALAQLDGYKSPLVSSLSGNLQRFGTERVAKVESLQEIIAEMSTSEDNPAVAAQK